MSARTNEIVLKESWVIGYILLHSQPYANTHRTRTPNTHTLHFPWIKTANLKRKRKSKSFHMDPLPAARPRTFCTKSGSVQQEVSSPVNTTLICLLGTPSKELNSKWELKERSLCDAQPLHAHAHHTAPHKRMIVHHNNRSVKTGYTVWWETKPVQSS